jgi:hypothetical protein
MPGKAYASIRLPRMYEALRRQGKSKESSARISNAHALERKIIEKRKEK